MWYDYLNGRDIVLVSPQLWGGMWVSKHWIADELSRHNRVLFVEPPVWLGGIVRDPFHSRLEAARLIRPLRRIHNNLFVFSPRLWPRWLLRYPDSILRQLRSRLDRLGFRDTVLLNFGTNPWLPGKVHDAVSVYYCVDPPFAAPGEEDLEPRTCRASDLIYAVSDAYREILQPYDPAKPVHVIPHGFPYAFAQQVLNDPAQGRPQELAALQGPILGYTGSVHDGYIDVGLLELLTRERPHYHFVLIGPYQDNPIGPSMSAEALARIRRLPNVHLLGYRHFWELPRYVKWFDACLVLHDLGRHAKAFETRKRTPFKMLQYLAQGKPVITPALSEVEAIKDLVYIASDAPDYLRQIDAAIGEPAENRRARMAYAEQFSFEKTLEKIVAPIREFERGPRPARLVGQEPPAGAVR
jgi:hypothetical protein